MKKLILLGALLIFSNQLFAGTFAEEERIADCARQLKKNLMINSKDANSYCRQEDSPLFYKCAKKIFDGSKLTADESIQACLKDSTELYSNCIISLNIKAKINTKDSAKYCQQNPDERMSSCSVNLSKNSKLIPSDAAAYCASNFSPEFQRCVLKFGANKEAADECLRLVPKHAPGYRPSFRSETMLKDFQEISNFVYQDRADFLLNVSKLMEKEENAGDLKKSLILNSVAHVLQNVSSKYVQETVVPVLDHMLGYWNEKFHILSFKDYELKGVSVDLTLNLLDLALRSIRLNSSDEDRKDLELIIANLARLSAGGVKNQELLNHLAQTQLRLERCGEKYDYRNRGYFLMSFRLLSSLVNNASLKGQ